MTRQMRLRMIALLLGCFGLLLLCLGVLPLRDHTVWWELALGRWIEMFGAIPTKNTMMFGATPDAPLVLPNWLAHLASFWTYRTLGMIEGVLTTRNVLCAVSTALAYGALLFGKKDPEALPIAPLLLGGACVVSVAPATSLMWALPLLALSLGAIKVVWAARAHWMAAAGSALLVASSVLWMNLDVSWLLLPGLCAFGALAPVGCGWTRRAMILGAGIGGVALGLGVHPLGVGALTHAVEILWLYPGQVAAGPGWEMIGVNPTGWLWLLVLVHTAIVVWGRWGQREARGQVAAYALAVVMFAGLATVHLRVMAEMGLVVIAWWPNNNSDRERAALNLAGLKTPWLLATAAACLLLGVAAQPVMITHQMTLAHLGLGDTRAIMPHKGIIPAATPIEPVELLAQYRVTPRIWASPRFEGYIHLRLNTRYPTPLTLGSPALEVLTPDQRTLVGLVRTTPDLWRGVFQQYGVEAVVLEKGGVDEGLIEQIYLHQDWSVMYEDDDMVYFLKSS